LRAVLMLPSLTAIETVGSHVNDSSVRGFTGTFTVSGTNGCPYNQTTGEFYLNDPNPEYSAS
jgi:hypothetical protein